VTSGLWIIAGSVALVVVAITIEAYLKRNRRQPLSRSQPDPKLKNRKNGELGQESSILDMVEQANQKNHRVEKTSKRLIHHNMK